MRSLRRQILMATVLVYALVTLAMLAAAHRLMTRAAADELQQTSQRSSALLSASLAPLLAARDLANAQDLLNLLVESRSFSYLRVDGRDGRTLVQAGDKALLAQLAASAGAAEHDHFSGPIALDGRQLGRLHFGLSNSLAQSTERALVTRLAAIGLGGLTLAAMLQLLISRVITRGIETLSTSADRLAAGEQGLQLPVQGDDEVARLTTSFNRMSAALAERINALENSELRQRLLTEALAEGVVFQDEHNRALSCNQAACDILGLTREQLLGHEPLDAGWQVLRPDGSLLEREQYPEVQALRSGRPVRDMQMAVQRRGRERVWLSVNSQPLVRPGERQPYATVTSFNDISAIVAAQQQLRQANEALEQRVAERTAELSAARDVAERASSAKSEFLSRMSHELRTPLNAILGFAQVLRLRLNPAPPGVDQQLQHIETAGWHLLDLINDVLDLSRIETGSMVVSADAVALTELVADCVRMAGPAMVAQQVTLDDQLGQAGELVVMADPTRLRQVMVNLLTNAAKYNRRGGRITLRAEADTDSVCLHVADTGIGLTAGQLQALYQPFNRLGAEATNVPGTGIGLVITKRLVELMGGTLQAQSVPGQGTEFTVRLRRGSRPPPPAPPTDDPAASAGSSVRTLLYVEDNPSNVQLLAEVLKLRPRLRLQSAADGPAGLALASAQRPDLVVVDIALPGMDGYTLCRHLRALPGLKRAPIVALSANAMDRDKARGVDAGFDRYFTKPIDVAQFLRWIDGVLETPG